MQSTTISVELEIWFLSFSVTHDILLSDITTFWHSTEGSVYLISKYRYAASGVVSESHIFGAYPKDMVDVVLSCVNSIYEKNMGHSEVLNSILSFGIILFCTSFWYFTLLSKTHSPFDWTSPYLANRLFFPYRKRTSHPLPSFVIIRDFFSLKETFTKKTKLPEK